MLSVSAPIPRGSRSCSARRRRRSQGIAPHLWSLDGSSWQPFRFFTRAAQMNDDGSNETPGDDAQEVDINDADVSAQSEDPLFRGTAPPPLPASTSQPPMQPPTESVHPSVPPPYATGYAMPLAAPP